MQHDEPDTQEQWCFDVDGTLVDSFDAQHVRPLVVELFVAIQRAGHAIHVWSAGGIAHARTVLERHGLAHHVTDVHDKVPGADGRWQLPDALVESPNVVCVDDQPDRLPSTTRVVGVFPYLQPNPHDRDLAPALANLAERAATPSSLS
ncbi:MAG: HAD family hydrolase [Actinomycetota bacterium]|nr:HAD family hydrolase [Actinomycetota bacterium]